jgi:hypothetical protein
VLGNRPLKIAGRERGLQFGQEFARCSRVFQGLPGMLLTRAMVPLNAFQPSNRIVRFRIVCETYGIYHH